MKTYLILHGGGGKRTVQPFADLLAQQPDTNVIVPIHPGFADTPRPAHLDSVRALAAYYLETTTPDTIVIGNSIGGWIATEMAISNKIAAAYLVNTTGFEIPGEPITDVTKLAPGELPKYSFHKPPPPAPNPPRPEFAALAAYAGAKGLDPTLLERAHQIRIPVHVLWGESDRIVTPAYGRAVAHAIPNATFTLIPESGHLPLLETPDRIIHALS
ncbi:MAG: alpha/beta hydrolase [Kofleriaceae bacterium]